MSAIDHSISITPEPPNKDLNYQVKDGKLHIAGKACVVKQGDKIITNPEQLQKLADVFNDTLSAKAKIGKNEVWSINPNRVQVLNRSFFNAHTEKIGKGVHAVKFKADMASDAPGVLQNLLRDFGVLAQDVEKAANPIVHPQSSGRLPAAPQERGRKDPVHLDESHDSTPPAQAKRLAPQRQSLREIEIMADESDDVHGVTSRPRERTAAALKELDELTSSDDGAVFHSFIEDHGDIQIEEFTLRPTIDEIKSVYEELIKAHKKSSSLKDVISYTKDLTKHAQKGNIEDRIKIYEQCVVILRREIEAAKNLPNQLEEARENHKNAFSVSRSQLASIRQQLMDSQLLPERGSELEGKKNVLEHNLENAKNKLAELSANQIGTKREVIILNEITKGLKENFPK